MQVKTQHAKRTVFKTRRGNGKLDQVTSVTSDTHMNTHKHAFHPPLWAVAQTGREGAWETQEAGRILSRKEKEAFGLREEGSG